MPEPTKKPYEGSPIVTLRIADPELLQWLDEQVARSVDRRFDEPHTRTSFIIAALREKRAHQQRSNRPRKKGGAA